MSGLPCPPCKGSGRIVTTWDFGGSVSEACSFCGGAGVIPRPPETELQKIIQDAVLAEMKRSITDNMFVKSPLLEALESKVAEAEQSMSTTFSMKLFGNAS